MNDQRLADEAARRRKELREEQARHAVTRQALREANRTAVRLSLQGRLVEPRDFEVYVGVDTVTDDDGRIEWARVETLVDELIAQRPHLATRRTQTDSEGSAVSSS